MAGLSWSAASTGSWVACVRAASRGRARHLRSRAIEHHLKYLRADEASLADLRELRLASPFEWRAPRSCRATLAPRYWGGLVAGGGGGGGQCCPRGGGREGWCPRRYKLQDMKQLSAGVLQLITYFSCAQHCFAHCPNQCWH